MASTSDPASNRKQRDVRRRRDNKDSRTTGIDSEGATDGNAAVLSKRVPGASTNYTWETRDKKPPLTYFLAIPLGQHPMFRASMSNFTSSLLMHTPPIPGLDTTIVIPARRLHFTLGVMNLSNEECTSTSPPIANERSPAQTIQLALNVLRALKSRLMDAIGEEPLTVHLDRMDIMKPEKGNPDKAHVLWMGPSLEGKDGKRFKSICSLIRDEFLHAGLIVDDKRPLKLHCTIVNTIYRKPRNKKGRRTPFSFSALLTSNTFNGILDTPMVPTDGKESDRPLKTSPCTPPAVSIARAPSYDTRVETHNLEQADEGEICDQKVGTAQRRKTSQQRGPFPVNMGTWPVNEVQICEMGSSGPEGEYVSVGGISLS